MGHAGTTFGTGTPTIYAVPPNPWSFSPYGGQGFGPQTFLPQPYAQTLPNPAVGSGYGITMPLLQQISQLLQIVPQQLQQLQVLQHQQLLYLQQLLQIVPAQLQHLIHVIPNQGQQLQQQPWQPFGAGVSGPLGVGVVAQPFAGQATGQVM